MKLNVCLLNDSFPPVIDGVANTVINYAGNIHEQLGSCTVVTPKYPDTDDDYIFPVYRYPSINTAKFTSSYRTGYPFGAKTLRTLEKNQFDIIHSHCPFASGLLARTLRERVDSPYVFTYHTKFDVEIAKVFTSESMQKVVTRLMINNISAADEIWVVSKGAGDNLRSMGYQGDTVVMENGVDMPAQRVSDDKIHALRAELDIPQDIPVFLFVGRCFWYKGLRISLDALRQLHAAGKDFRFIVVGNGLDFDEIKAYAETIGIAQQCIFTGSIYDRERLRTFFGLADLFLFPSSYDTNGLVVREAAANELASMIIENSCAAEGITDGKNGLLIKENADDMAKKLVWVCEHREKVHHIGKQAQEDIYISWQDAVNKAYHRYEYLYQQLKNGQLTRNEVKGNGLFELVADWAAAIDKLQSVPRTMLDKTSSIYEKFKKNTR